MALFNSFKFGDVDSKDYGVYISGDSVYDSPARSVDLVQVPGRNGALALDNGYYENIEVTYPAGSFGASQEEWREKMLGIRNALAAQRGYQKLIDTYHPEHYRLGMFFAGISATPVQYNRAGRFPIRFNCKPQRFLISGDEAVEFTAEGQEEVYGPDSIVSFEAKAGAEIRELKVNLEPIQSGSGDPSPSNIRPISGHTEVNVYRTGKNLFDIDSAFGSATGFTKESDGSWYTGAPISYSPNSVVWKAPSGLTGRITLSVVRKTANSTGSQGGRFKWKYTDGATSGVYIANSTSYASFSNVSTSGKTVDSLLWDCGSAVNGTWLKDMQIEAGTTASPYEPFGTTADISLGQTVYGGTLNVTTGVLTVDRKYVLYDGSSDENWSRFSTGSAGAYAMRIAAPDILQSASDVNVMSNYLPAIAGNATWGNYDYFIATTTNAAIYTGIRSITTVGAWRDYLAQNNLQVVYKLATPTTVQLTATQVSTLLGENNIWSDSGEVEVKVASPVDLTNPTNFPAKPLIRVYGNGSVRVGDTIATVQNNADGYVDIDCESMNCYDTTGGRNADVSFSGNDFPELASGDNGILLTGPSRVEITPRWWEL